MSIYNFLCGSVVWERTDKFDTFLVSDLLVPNTLQLIDQEKMTVRICWLYKSLSA